MIHPLTPRHQPCCQFVAGWVHITGLPVPQTLLPRAEGFGDFFKRMSWNPSSWSTNSVLPVFTHMTDGTTYFLDFDLCFLSVFLPRSSLLSSKLKENFPLWQRTFQGGLSLPSIRGSLLQPHLFFAYILCILDCPLLPFTLPVSPAISDTHYFWMQKVWKTKNSFKLQRLGCLVINLWGKQRKKIKKKQQSLKASPPWAVWKGRSSSVMLAIPCSSAGETQWSAVEVCRGASSKEKMILL